MKYDKPPLSFDAQADLLIKRGLVVDRTFLIDRLKDVNYYRLSGYLHPYRQSGDNFKSGTTFEKIWRHYTFDRRLRLIVMDAIERFEVSIKTQLIYALAHSTGAFGYANASNFPGLSAEDHGRLIKTIADEAERSKEKFVDHLKIAPQSKWKARLCGLLDEYPEISRWSMGFPDNWKDSPLWKDGA